MNYTNIVRQEARNQQIIIILIRPSSGLGSDIGSPSRPKTSTQRALAHSTPFSIPLQVFHSRLNPTFDVRIKFERGLMATETPPQSQTQARIAGTHIYIYLYHARRSGFKKKPAQSPTPCQIGRYMTSLERLRAEFAMKNASPAGSRHEIWARTASEA